MYGIALTFFIFLSFAASGLGKKAAFGIAFVIYAAISALLGLRMNFKFGMIGAAAYAVMLGVFPLFNLNNSDMELSPAVFGNIFYPIMDGIKPVILRYLLSIIVPLLPVIAGMIIGVKKKGNGIDNSEEKALNKKTSVFQSRVFCIAIPFILELIISVFYFLIAFDGGYVNEMVLSVILYAVLATVLGYFMDSKWGFIGLAVYAVPLVVCPFIHYDDTTAVLRFFAQNGNVFYSMICSRIESEALRYIASIAAAVIPFIIGIVVRKFAPEKAKKK